MVSDMGRQIPRILSASYCMVLFFQVSQSTHSWTFIFRLYSYCLITILFLIPTLSIHTFHSHPSFSISSALLYCKVPTCQFWYSTPVSEASLCWFNRLICCNFLSKWFDNRIVLRIGDHPIPYYTVIVTTNSRVDWYWNYVVCIVIEENTKQFIN